MGGRPLGFAPPGWRNNPSAPQRRAYEGRDGELAVDYARTRAGLELSVNGEPLERPLLGGEPRPAPPGGRGHVELTVGGVRREFRLLRRGNEVHVSSALGHCSLTEQPRYPSETSAAEGALVAPMPGKVIKLVAAEGAELAAATSSSSSRR